MPVWLTWENAISVLVLTAALIGWGWIIRNRVTKKLPIVEPLPRERPFWTLGEFFVCFGLFIICTGAGQTVAQRFFSPETLAARDANTFKITDLSTSELTIMITASSLAGVAAMAAVVVWMNLLSRERLDRYGFIPSKADVILGLKASALVLPVVVLINSLVTTVVDYEHPVLDIIGASPTVWSLSVLVITTVIWTPIFEEFLFRALLQGGAEQMSQRIRNLSPRRGEADPSPAPAHWMVTPADVATWSWWPVVISSLVFATLHLGQGGAVVPLFFLAIALGYLYRQTGRIGPGIVVHFVLNGFTITIAIVNSLFN